MARPKKEEKPKEQEKEVIAEKAVETPVLAGGPKKIKVTHDQMMKLQSDGKLIGYDPATGIAIINE